MNSSRLLPFMIYSWLLAAFIFNYSTAKKKGKKHCPKCMTYKSPLADSKSNSDSSISSSSQSNSNEHKRVKRLINGWEGDIRQMPWMVYISSIYDFRNQTRVGNCTASLISPRHVLTAAHCIPRSRMIYDNHTITVVYGSANKNGGHRIVLNKTAAHIHPNYTSYILPPNAPTINDLAILDLGQDVEFDETVHSICVVCLGKGNTSNPEGNVTIAGWGDMAAGGPCSGQPSVYPDVFRWDIVRAHPCLTPYKVKDDKVCTEANSQHSIGGGDSGGPVLSVRNNTNDVRQYQIGVNGGNTCVPSLRENSFDKIDGKWVEQLTGVKCKNFNED